MVMTIGHTVRNGRRFKGLGDAVSCGGGQRGARACALLGARRLAAGEQASLRAGQCRHRQVAGAPSSQPRISRGSSPSAAGAGGLRRHRTGNPLVAVMGDPVEPVDIRAFGPSKPAAHLEGSKAFIKAFCERHDIPTAAYGRFPGGRPAKALPNSRSPGRHQGGRARAGKGVIIAATSKRRRGGHGLRRLRRNRTQGRGRGFMNGEEAAPCALRWRAVIPLVGAQDHKRAFDGDRGPNTGGTGAYCRHRSSRRRCSPASCGEIVRPTAWRWRRGNAVPGRALFRADDRQGGAEARRVQWPLRRSRMPGGDDTPHDRPPPALVGALDGALAHLDLRWSREASLTVVMASQGYPGDYGGAAKSAGSRAPVEGVQIFHAGTRRRQAHPRQRRPRAQRHRAWRPRSGSPRRAYAPTT